MTSSQHYSQTYKLDKTLLNECFEQSMTGPVTWLNYRKAIVFVVVGMVLLMATEVDGYLASFVVGLGIVEALSVKYQQAWWVARQLLGRSGNSDVTVTINEQGIQIKSAYVEQQISWQEIDNIQSTEKGFLVLAKGQKSYLSASVLSEDAQHYMLAKVSNN